MSSTRSARACSICGAETSTQTKVNGAIVCAGNSCHKQALATAYANRRRPLRVTTVPADQIKGRDQSPLPATEEVTEGPTIRPVRRRTRREQPVRYAETPLTRVDEEMRLHLEKVRKHGWDCGGCWGHFPATVPHVVTANGWRCPTCLSTP